MLDFGWSEAFLIVLLAVFLFGPEDIPKVLVSFGRVFRRLQYVKFALSQQFDDLMREADLDDLRSSVNFESKRFEKNFKKQILDSHEGDEDAEYFKEPAPVAAQTDHVITAEKAKSAEAADEHNA